MLFFIPFRLPTLSTDLLALAFSRVLHIAAAVKASTPVRASIVALLFTPLLALVGPFRFEPSLVAFAPKFRGFVFLSHDEHVTDRNNFSAMTKSSSLAGIDFGRKLKI